MISLLSSGSSTAHHQPGSGGSTVTIVSPKAPDNSTTETASIGGGGFALWQDRPPAGDKSYAAQLGLHSPETDYSKISVCPFAAGQYTEF